MGSQRFALNLWRAVALHPDAQTLCVAVWPHLLEVWPVRQAALWHIDPELPALELTAHVHQGAAAPLGVARPLTNDLLQRFRDYCQAGLTQRGPLSAFTNTPVAPLLPELRAGYAAIPLGIDPADPFGVLLLAGLPARLDDAQLALLAMMRQPFTTALGNHVRTLRLSRVAEAFRADKQALLSRLDRQDISDSVIGGETGLRDVVEQVRQVAPTNAPVLIFGETGAGKEVVARQIHSMSVRATGPMVRVNCGAIPPELVDSELFGHERGSFTGAVSTRKGWFERADGGTLFLDEIGELPLAAQVRVLRVLQDGVFERVGGERPLHVDVRIVAATHRNLEAMVRAGSFRHDLWYRIGVFPIRLPPLRERREDIPALAAHFARRATKRLGGLPLGLQAADIARLVSYDWPGNVRELAAVIERAAILGNGRCLEIAQALGIATPSPAVLPPQRAAAVPTTFDDHSRQCLEAALTQSHGRIEGPFGAAQALRVNPNTLRARMRRLGVDWRAFRKKISA